MILGESIFDFATAQGLRLTVKNTFMECGPSDEAFPDEIPRSKTMPAFASIKISLKQDLECGCLHAANEEQASYYDPNQYGESEKQSHRVCNRESEATATLQGLRLTVKNTFMEFEMAGDREPDQIPRSKTMPAQASVMISLTQTSPVNAGDASSPLRKFFYAEFDHPDEVNSVPYVSQDGFNEGQLSTTDTEWMLKKSEAPSHTKMPLSFSPKVDRPSLLNDRNIELDKSSSLNESTGKGFDSQAEPSLSMASITKGEVSSNTEPSQMAAKEAHAAGIKEAHAAGLCQPCYYHASKYDGCRHGNSCLFCHDHELEDFKKHRRERKKARKEAQLTN
jgi:hypothetical protein